MKQAKIKSVILLMVLAPFFAFSQNSDVVKKSIDDLNRAIDHAVVKKDISKLEASYADDFVFTHGTGLVDSKESWIRNVKKPEMRFISREHDSTQVELHDNVAILTGKLTVKREDQSGIHNYSLRYVRVFALRNNKWVLISHRTTKEWDN